MLIRNLQASRLARYFLLAITVGSLQYILERGHEDDWFESKVITTFNINFILWIYIFIWRELNL